MINFNPKSKGTTVSWLRCSGSSAWVGFLCVLPRVFIHGWQTHQFWISWLFPDFSLIKVKFPWLNKCKISDMEAASILRLQQSFAPIWPEMFLPSFDGIKSVLQFQFSLTFLQNANFPWPRIKFPDISLTLKNFFFPDHFLTCGNQI